MLISFTNVVKYGIIYNMKIMYRWQCWIKEIIRSLWIGWPFNYPMSGHDFVNEEIHKNCTVTISRCETCGKLNIDWHQ